jgi:hypothetical protein
VEHDVTIAVHLSEDDTDTLATMTLELRGDHFEAVGKARRNPIDPPLPTIGEELAIARALSNLQEAVMEAARDRIERFTVHV